MMRAQTSILGRHAVLGLASVIVLSEIAYVVLWSISFHHDSTAARQFLVCMGALFLLYAAAYAVVRKHAGNNAKLLLLVIVGSILFRTTMLGVGIRDHSSREILVSLRDDVRGTRTGFSQFLFFDDDIWRYLWDGHVSSRGISPYSYAPARPELDHLDAGVSASVWSNIRSKVNHPDLPTVYPPLSQVVFWAANRVAPGSVLIWKIIVTFFDVLTAFFIALTLQALNRPVTAALLYAWNPLVIAMTAGSGHIDSLAALLLAAMAYFLTRKAYGLSSLSLALSVTAKIAPIVLLPLLLTRVKVRHLLLFAGVLVALFLPFSRGGAVFKGFFVFAYKWQFNSALFMMLKWLGQALTSDPAFLARIVSLFAIGSIVMWLMFRDHGTIEEFFCHGAATIGCLLVLGSVVMPWYSIWLLPFAVLAGSRLWVAWSALICFSALMMVDWQPRTWVLVLEYGSFVLLFLTLCGSKMARTGILKLRMAE